MMNPKKIAFWWSIFLMVLQTGLQSCYDSGYYQTAKVESGNVKSYAGVSKDNVRFTNTDPVPGDSGKLAVSYPGGGIVLLSWERASDAETPADSLLYRVYYGQEQPHVTGVGNMQTYGTGIGTYLTKIDSALIDTLQPLTDYYLSVMVKDKNTNKVAYRTIFARVPENIPPLPGNSSHIVTADASETSISLAWSPATDDYTPQSELQYLVYYSLSDNITTVSDCESNGSSFGVFLPEDTSTLVTGLNSSTLYYFNVVVKDSRGAKTAYHVTHNTTLFDDPPIPGGSGEIYMTFIGTTAIYLQWPYAEDDVSEQDNLNYLLYYSNTANISTVADCEVNGTPKGSFAANINSGYADGFTAGTQWYFNVVIKDEAGNKCVYQMATFTTAANDDPPVPGNDGLLASSGITHNSISLSWTKATDNESLPANLNYLVYYSLADNIGTVAGCESNGTPFGTYAPDFDLENITGLTSNTTYYFNVLVKDQSNNKSAYQSFSATTAPYIGDFYQGGIVFYVNAGTGLICSLHDQSSGAQWGCYGTALTGCSGTSIGTGRTNSGSIVSNCADAGIAARLCDNYSYGLYSDWFLPSTDEKSTLNTNLTVVNTALVANGGTIIDLSGTNDYWTSTQMPATASLIVIPPTGSNDKNKAYTWKSNADKNTSKRVRAIRSF